MPSKFWDVQCEDDSHNDRNESAAAATTRVVVSHLEAIFFMGNRGSSTERKQKVNDQQKVKVGNKSSSRNQINQIKLH